MNRNFLVVAQTMPGAASMQNLAVTTRFAVTKFGGVADVVRIRNAGDVMLLPSSH